MTAASSPDAGLNQTVDFMAERFIAVVGKLAERDAAIQRVLDLCASAEAAPYPTNRPFVVGRSFVSTKRIRSALGGAE